MNPTPGGAAACPAALGPGERNATWPEGLRARAGPALTRQQAGEEGLPKRERVAGGSVQEDRGCGFEQAWHQSGNELAIALMCGPDQEMISHMQLFPTSVLHCSWGGVARSRRAEPRPPSSVLRDRSGTSESWSKPADL